MLESGGHCHLAVAIASDDRGQDMVEYALLAAFLALAVAAAVLSLGENMLVPAYHTIANAVPG